MVSKLTTDGAKNTSRSAAAKKTTVKETSVKVSEKSKELNKQVPVKENVDPMKKVLEIKAQNEKKKVAKTAAKAKAKPAKKVAIVAAPVVEKGAKAQINRAKTQAVKNSAQKSSFKKITETKVENKSVAKKSSNAPKGGAWAAWARAYKNIFNFKGRTSRYELWSFMLINFFMFILACAILGWFLQTTVPSMATLVGLGIFLVVEAFVYLTLSVRRLHDGGYSAWKGFFRPLIIAGILTAGIYAGSTYVIPSEQVLMESSKMFLAGIFAYCVLFFVALLVYVYHTVKIFIVSFFYEGDKETNAYGKAYFNDAYYKAKGLRYTALFYMVITIISYVISNLRLPYQY